MPPRIRKTITIGHDPITGKPIRKSFCGKTKKAVNAAIDKFKLEASTGVKEEADITTFSCWADTWLKMYKEKTVSDSTYRGYVLCVKHLSDEFGHVPINLITPTMCQRFFTKKANLSGSMLNKMRNTTNAIFETAIDNGYAFRNPIKNIKIPKGSPKAQKCVFTAEQAEVVKHYALESKDGLGVYIVLNTGVRRGELMGLKSEDFHDGRVYVKRTVQESGGVLKIKNELKNGDAERIIPIEPKAYSRIINMIPDSGFVFPSMDNPKKPLAPGNWAKRNLERFYSELPEDIPRLKPHELRHTYGTLLFKSGTDPYAIQKVMGHRSLDITMGIYVHEGIEDVEKRMKWSFAE